MAETTKRPIRLGLVGLGKIARDQHVPALAADPRFAIVATASHDGALDGIPAYPDIAAMIASGHDLDAVSLCTPPAGRHATAASAIAAGLHVMLEKPPAPTVAEAEDLVARAATRGVSLFATWHSREAAAVSAAREWLAARSIETVRIVWKEDIRRWHPGQEWILNANGFGVFDPGINALSILTHILPRPIEMLSATIAVPEGRAAPIAATLAMRTGATAINAVFDFRETGQQQWDIQVDAQAGRLCLSDGGRTLSIGDGPPTTGADAEYPRLYTRFADLVARRGSDVDLAPLRLVSDALRLATRAQTGSFFFDDRAPIVSPRPRFASIGLIDKINHL